MTEATRVVQTWLNRGRYEVHFDKWASELPKRVLELLTKVGNECFDEGSSAEAEDEINVDNWEGERDERVRDAILNQMDKL